MNEPAVFVDPTDTMPLDVRHDNEGQPTDHREIHNVYGHADDAARPSRACCGCGPSERPFVLTRATFAGGQRYAALWPGDNVSDWPTLARLDPDARWAWASPGFPFVGSRHRRLRGGAVGRALHALAAARRLLPVHAHAHRRSARPTRSPGRTGTRHEAINRRAIELRYELLPQIYNVMREASETGVPALRPLFLEFPEDPADLRPRRPVPVRARPAGRAGAARGARPSASVYLPAGDWYDFWTGRRATGGRRLTRARHARLDPDLRPRRRLRLPPAGGPAHGRDAGPAAERRRLSRRRARRPSSTRTTARASTTRTGRFARRRFAQRAGRGRRDRRGERAPTGSLAARRRAISCCGSARTASRGACSLDRTPLARATACERRRLELRARTASSSCGSATAATPSR